MATRTYFDNYSNCGYRYDAVSESYVDVDSESPVTPRSYDGRRMGGRSTPENVERLVRWGYLYNVQMDSFHRADDDRDEYDYDPDTGLLSLRNGGGIKPKIQARFKVEPVGVGLATLGARAASGDFPLGDVRSHVVQFSEGDSKSVLPSNGDPRWVTLFARDGVNRIPRKVDLASSPWNWHVDSVEGESLGEEFVFASTGPHKVYTVLAHPVESWKRANGDPQSAWTLALDHACEWAKGATTENAALAAVTRNLFYSCGKVYNANSQNANATYVEGGMFSPLVFNLSGYVLRNRSDLILCTDQAFALYLLGELLGVEMTVKRMEPFGTLNLATRPLVGFASNSGFTSVTFGNHFFVMNGQKVFDSCVGPVVGEEIDQYLSGSILPSCTHGTINDIEDFEYVEHLK